MTAPQLERAARRALEDAPAALVLDLDGVTFLASPGLAVLVRTDKLARDDGRTSLRIVAGGSAALRSLQLTGLGEVFVLYPSRREAISGQ